METTKNLSIATYVSIALMAAVICVLAPFSIPLPSLVPISLAPLAIYFTAYVLGCVKGTISCAIYLLLGLIGLPVFSSFSSGPGKLFGPTGGYLIGYLFLSLICGFVVERFDNRIIHIIGFVIATAVLYAFGTAWFVFQQKTTWGAAIVACVLPFLIGDAIKIAIACIVGPELRKRLLQAGLL